MLEGYPNLKQAAMKTLGPELWRIFAHFAIAPARGMLFIIVYQRLAIVN